MEFKGVLNMLIEGVVMESVTLGFDGVYRSMRVMVIKGGLDKYSTDFEQEYCLTILDGAGRIQWASNWTKKVFNDPNEAISFAKNVINQLYKKQPCPIG